MAGGFKKFLSVIGFGEEEDEELLAEENVELAQRLGIMQAPTLLKVAQDGTVAATVGAAAVLQKVKALSAAALA